MDGKLVLFFLKLKNYLIKIMYYNILQNYLSFMIGFRRYF